MGGGDYSSSRSVSNSRVYADKSNKEIFANSVNNAMSPYGLGIRESRDSMEHPESLAIIIALDVTGSMGSVPNYLVKKGLNNIMEKIIEGGIKDPQVLFLGIGDHECDKYPLQVAQFESSDIIMDKWLTSVFIEGGGGGNAGESYLLAWQVAVKHTSIDCFEKRGQKGFLFTIGDEQVLEGISKESLKRIFGEGQYGDLTADQLLIEACKKYNVFHIHIRETRAGQEENTVIDWKQKIQNGLIIAKKHEEVSELISDKILQEYISPIKVNEKDQIHPVGIIL